MIIEVEIYTFWDGAGHINVIISNLPTADFLSYFINKSRQAK